MDLPKNITQIGEADRNCKIFIEDYVTSYIKQLNQLARNKDMAVALYGIRKSEDGIAYLFVYGACKLDFLQREARHLSQAQHQEIEKLRKKYFVNHEFLGYRLLNGEMVEGFHICEQEVCRYIAGYAQFYEKNDTMLAYMLDTRSEQSAPETVSQEKFEEVKKRQEERKADIPKEQISEPGMRKMRMSVTVAFGLLCVVGLATLGDGTGMNTLQNIVREAVSGLTEQKLPDVEEVAGEVTQKNTLIAEDKLEEALQQENANSLVTDVLKPDDMTAQETATTPVPEVTETPISATTDAPVSAATDALIPGVTETSVSAVTETPVPEAPATLASEAEAVVSTPVPVMYIIRNGDTLIGISISNYGNESMVKEICAANGIENPDDIKEGQKILLP